MYILNSYLEVIKRRKFHFIIPAIVIFSAQHYYCSSLLPPIYKATATIVDRVACSLSRISCTAARRATSKNGCQTLSKRVMSNRNLLMTVERFGLYTDLGDENTSQRLVEEMRENILIEHVTTEVLSERSGRPMPITTSFTVSFEGEEPEKIGRCSQSSCFPFFGGKRQRSRRKGTHHYPVSRKAAGKSAFRNSRH